MQINIKRLVLRQKIQLIGLLFFIIGGLNWGLVGLFNLDLVAAIFGAGSIISRIIYILVGLAALYMIYFATKADTYHRADTAVHH